MAPLTQICKDDNRDSDDEDILIHDEATCEGCVVMKQQRLEREALGAEPTENMEGAGAGD